MADENRNENGNGTPLISQILQDGIDAWFADGRENLRPLLNRALLTIRVQSSLQEKPEYIELCGALKAGQQENETVSKLIDLVKLAIPLIMGAL